MKSVHASIQDDEAFNKALLLYADACEGVAVQRADEASQTTFEAASRGLVAVIDAYIAPKTLAGHRRPPTERDQPMNASDTAVPDPASAIAPGIYGNEIYQSLLDLVIDATNRRNDGRSADLTFLVAEVVDQTNDEQFFAARRLLAAFIEAHEAEAVAEAVAIAVRIIRAQTKNGEGNSKP